MSQNVVERFFQNRIVGYFEKPANQFLFNPRNVRVHPKEQSEGNKASLEVLGWIQTVIENKRTGNLIDGHDRVWIALQANEEEPVPYLLVDLTEEEEHLAIVTFDRLNRLAGTDPEKLEEALALIAQGGLIDQSDVLMGIVSDYAEAEDVTFAVGGAVIDDLIDEDEEDEEDIYEFDETPILERPDAVFASSNDYGIPTLRLEWQATFIQPPVTRWGRYARHTKSTHYTTVHFYTDDYKFNALWKDPMTLVQSGCLSIVEPNISLCDEHPFAVALWAVYRKRWLTRFVNHHNVTTFVDLNVPEKWDELNLTGVPEGWGSYATRYNPDVGIQDLDRQFDLACSRALTTDIRFMVAGATKAVSEHCKRMGWFEIPVMDVRE